MKLTRLPDGTLQIEGTAEEVRALLAPPKEIPPQPPPLDLMRFSAAAPPVMGPVWCGTIKAGGWGINNAAAALPWFHNH